MRTPLLILLCLLATSATAAESLRLPPAEPPQAGNSLPLAGSTAGKAKAGSCAAYGPRFVMVEGTGTCVQLGGAISVDTIRR
ncbi:MULTISPECIES: hypothetical protein [Bradyrhizobium]|uniref:hypothetical protein n=1 Tax=Bradyrhizobium TaxID=374 RepID=UPI00155DE50C|nr:MULTISPECIES: hypothetical protein [Bradyrhizobium]MDD1520927.1 hypothetical protein [Bradyrhizobium sp. WBAH30]MDD1546609.1 hypothetical protein [Bradyrhizobium sp. WBAH41]MDD1560384.1 hypothetical protein [Bradyrhizobium sp. WBAH23]MDD1567807.1 hypothetical protein [Bradyrhizobium sp. WBAH33]MDD1594021.1 hypothetical protein [Bradyrhizobium sp. WBAH42]